MESKERLVQWASLSFPRTQTLWAESICMGKLLRTSEMMRQV